MVWYGMWHGVLWCVLFHLTCLWRRYIWRRSRAEWRLYSSVCGGGPWHVMVWCGMVWCDMVYYGVFCFTWLVFEGDIFGGEVGQSDHFTRQCVEADRDTSWPRHDQRRRLVPAVPPLQVLKHRRVTMATMWTRCWNTGAVTRATMWTRCWNTGGRYQGNHAKKVLKENL